jgi:hypothetical protein
MHDDVTYDHKAMQILRDRAGTLVGEDFGHGDQHWQFICGDQVGPLCDDPALAVVLWWEGKRYREVTEEERAQLLAAIKKQLEEG